MDVKVESGDWVDNKWAEKEGILVKEEGNDDEDDFWKKEDEISGEEWERRVVVCGHRSSTISSRIRMPRIVMRQCAHAWDARMRNKPPYA